MTRDELQWFRSHHRKNCCVMGNDYYATNENIVHEDGRLSLAGEIFGYYPITHQYFTRYNLPVVHTETNGLGGRDPVFWLSKEWANVHRLKQDGVSLVPARGTSSFECREARRIAKLDRQGTSCT